MRNKLSQFRKRGTISLAMSHCQMDRDGIGRAPSRCFIRRLIGKRERDYGRDGRCSR